MKTKKGLIFILSAIFAILPAYALAEDNKIVSLAPLATEIIYALNLQNQLIGVTDICKLEDKRDVKRLGAYSAINLEVVYNLKPSLVVVTEGAENQAEMLRGLGLRVYEVKTSSFSNLKKSVLEFSKIMSVEDQAEILLKENEERLAKIIKRHEEDQKKTNILILFGEDGSHLGSSSFYGIGLSTFYNDLVELIGLNNSLRQNGYNILSLEGVCSLKPDCILIASDQSSIKELEEIRVCHKDAKFKVISKTPFLYPGIKYPEIAESIALCLGS